MGTILARTGLTKPARGDLNWDDEIQAWLDKLDTYGAFADETLTWTATQTFTQLQASFLTLASPQLVTLTADDQLITPTSSFIVISSDSSGAASTRTFTLATPTVAGLPTSGTLLWLLWQSTKLGEIVGAAHIGLTAAWPSATPLWDTLLLGSYANVWFEISRSANTAF